MSTQPESKHTQGRWERYGHIGHSGLTRVRACTGKDVIGREMFVDVPANEADARLIAAAPELLEACLSALARFEVEQSFGPHRQQLYAAIFLATGVPVDNQSDDMDQNTSSCE